MLSSLNTIASLDSKAKLILYLYMDSLHVKTVVVTKDSSICVLDKVCKSDTFLPIYILKGTILAKNMHFRSYDIQNESCIYVTNNVANYFCNKKNIDDLMIQDMYNNHNSDIQIKARLMTNNDFRKEMCFIMKTK